MIEVLNILRDLDRIQGNFIELVTNPRTRGHPFKLKTIPRSEEKEAEVFIIKICKELW